MREHQLTLVHILERRGGEAEGASDRKSLKSMADRCPRNWKPLGPAFRYFGGKSRYAKRLLDCVPQHSRWIEPFAGGASLTLAKVPSRDEVLGEIRPDVIKFFNRVKTNPKPLDCGRESQAHIDKAARTPLAERSVCNFLVLQRGSFGAKSTWGSLAWHRDSGRRRIVSNQLSRNYPRYHERLRNVRLESADYKQTVHRYDSPETFIFLDPPYPSKGRPYYEYERGVPRLAELRKTLENVRGKFMMTYPSRFRKEFRGHPFHTTIVRVPLSHRMGREQKTRGELLVSNYDLRRVPGCKPA